MNAAVSGCELPQKLMLIFETRSKAIKTVPCFLALQPIQVLAMRNTTEYQEAVDAGTVKLVGTDFNKIVQEVSALLEDKIYYNSMSEAHNPYGDGSACQRIIQYLQKHLIRQEQQ